MQNIDIAPLHDDAGDRLAGLGRWWLDPVNGRITLSAVAASFFGTGRHPDCLARIEPDDRTLVHATLDRIRKGDGGAECEFRVRTDGLGLRWLRLQQTGTSATGILVDVTAARQAAARERFNFALTQYLVGTDSIDDAVTGILQLVCEELGWEWGAFWALDDRTGTLRCRYAWQAPRQALAPFRAASARLAMAPGEGLIGTVWDSGEARWIEDASGTADLLRAEAARACGLQSAYFFPVTFVASDACLMRPGVLEFFSVQQRQPDAQLPGLAKSISAMIAQAVERMTQQERIRVRAQTDEMTGLANRAHFYDQVDRQCRDARAGQTFGVLFVDLDQFKPINDAFGHDAGNVVLTTFASRLRALAPPGWRIGRLGGDEFALLSAPGVTPQELERVAESVLDAARRRFVYGEHRLAVSASIGISTYPDHGGCTRELLHAADAAMYASKRNGRNLASRFSGDGAPADAGHRIGLLTDLHCAIRRGEFFLEYQPIRTTTDMDIDAVEALIRWRRPNGEIVPPNVFIPLAEQSRLIVDIGRWVVRQACHDLARLRAAGLGGVRVHVNMAAPEFIDAELPDRLTAIAAAAGVDPRGICLELTEGVVMKHADKSIAIMRELRRRGFGIGLDDFGMGYSSLSLLKNLPIGSLKIDRLFMAGVPYDRNDCAIVRSLLDLGRHMKLTVVAEGVETDAQLGYLRQFGCPLVQGWLPGRPVPLERLFDLIAQPQAA
ncbi:putative bifunctional diguanylate cyclase/phosphodiesterase [Telluria sp. Tellsp104]